ncbi:MAG: hypothetical protein R3C69_01895 [Geminicoccaceae bacterium]
MQTAMETFFGEDDIVSFSEYDATLIRPAGRARGRGSAGRRGGQRARPLSLPRQLSLPGQNVARIGVVGPADVQLDTPGVYNHLLPRRRRDRDPPALRPEGGERQRPFDPEDLDGRRLLAAARLHDRAQFEHAGPAAASPSGPAGRTCPKGPRATAMWRRWSGTRRGDRHSKRTTGHIPPGRFARTTFELFHPHGEKETPNAEIVTLADWRPSPTASCCCASSAAPTTRSSASST